MPSIVNDNMTFSQAATVLNSIVSQATGQTGIAATNTADFISQAQTALKTGYDPLLSAISQVLSRTIFSIRPYEARFKGLQRDQIAWGNHVRKIKYGAMTVENDDRRALVDGQSLDQQIVRKPDVVQTNWYSFDTYQHGYTIFRDQLDVAFSSPEEFQRFISGMMTNVSNTLESYRENFDRMTLLNFMGAKINLGTGHVRHLVTEFATAYSIEDASTVLVDHLPAFVKWLFAELKTLSDRFTERTTAFQQNLTGHTILQHTPKNRQRLYLYSPFLAKIDAQVLADVFNPEYLTFGDREEVSYWQSFDTPAAINVTPSTITAAGVAEAGAAVSKSNVLGILMDYEAVGTTSINEWSSPAPFNARGGYTTVWYHMDRRGWNDLTEKAIVLLLD